MSEPPLIDIRNATLYRGDTRVFSSLTLTIRQHEQVTVIGPNGAGKTTLLKVLNREIYPVVKEGSWVKLLGSENWNVWKLRAEIGIVSDDLQFRYGRRATGLDVVLSGFFSSVGTHGSLAHGVTAEKRTRALAIMTELGVREFADTELGRMSTGQQRRCLLARALVHDPTTLILDEPTTGLDLAASFDYLSRIRRLIEAGRNVVLVTHHLNEIPPDVDRVILLRQGEIVADGNKAAVLNEANLTATFGVPMRLEVIDGYYLPYPAESRAT